MGELTPEAWAANVLARRRSTIEKVVSAEGVCDRMVGGRQDRAGITVVAEPSSEWRVKFETSAADTAELVRASYGEAAIYGLIDVLATVPESPLLDLLIRVVKVEIDPISSSQHAFRIAGRRAGREVLLRAGVPTFKALRSPD